MRSVLIAVIVAALLTGPASAQAVRSEKVASNGVAVTVFADEFANRYEYTAPSVTLDEGYVLVARVKSADDVGAIRLIGTFAYGGDWRFYDSAIFRGGSPATFVEAGREVGRCRASRYGSGCTLNESFQIVLTPEQVAEHTVDGKLSVQIRAQRTAATKMVEVPVSYIEAVTEVSGS